MKKPTPFGKYYLLERINVGGMAEVFRAKAFGVEGFERLVAVKRILPNIAEDKEFIRMFVEEAKLAVQLNHANIAQIFDLGVVDGAYFIALEHIHGRDLRGVFDRCRQLGDPMPVAQACFVVMKLCEGLDYAHNKRDQAGRELHLVHRDVSPQNVLISFEGEVKIIDFGIAKAANKGNKTQAGILKGKFGYMSPEQVRGIPIDRRSDVFSCGIVLYEMLTGERLFVGESDFSTLEKVRNVEILPPSTYNRRIPDELERIVLKALAKDPEDRYQNAIDLHDELQAFVYTAGEFYSRKDLAGWMKKTFGREIEEETAKLEGYRQLKAPAEVVSAPPPAVSRTATASKPPATPPRRTQAMASVGAGGTKPPPPPTRMSQQMPVVSAAAAAAAAAASAAPAPTTPTAKIGKRQVESGELAWDDDELETQIYDDDGEPGSGKSLPRAAKPGPNSSGAQIPLVAPPSTPAPEILTSPAVDTLKGTGGPDLSSLVSTAKGWDGGPAATPSNGTSKAPPFANGSGKGPAPSPIAKSSAPMPSVPHVDDDPIAAALAMPQPVAREISAPSRLVSSSESPFGGSLDGAAGSFGSGMLARRQPKNRAMLFIAAGGAALAVVAVILVIAMTGGKKDSKPDKAVGGGVGGDTAVAANPQATAPTAAGPSDPNTGFDLYVYPAGVATWRLDGDQRTDKLPSRIRGISAGMHQVTIDAPAGFVSQNAQIPVELGKAQKVEIQLQPLAGIHGDFESTPPGATVSLIVDGKREPLGPSPAKAALDPRKTYQVLFEKPGFVSVNRPVVFTGAIEEKVEVTLDKAGAAVADNTATSQPVTQPSTAQPSAPITQPSHPAQPSTAIAAANPSTANPANPTKNPSGGGSSSRPITHPSSTPDHVASGDSGGGKIASPDFGDTVSQPKAPAQPQGDGTLLLGSKPPCEILIDGSSTGQHTPVRDLKLSAGKHKITLVNSEFGINESFTVNIKAGETEKQIKDYSDRVNK